MSAVALVMLTAAAPKAANDPCWALKGERPTPDWLAAGKTIDGPLVYVADGQTICIAPFGKVSPHDRWVKLRVVADAPDHTSPGPRRKAALEREVKNKRLSCLLGERRADLIEARCSIDGQPLSQSDRGALRAPQSLAPKPAP